MLSEILEAAAPTRRNTSDRVLGITMSALFPCPYRLRLVHEGSYYSREVTPQEYYNMADGTDQEEQSVRRLARAGVIIKNRQRVVYVGKSRVVGHYDGDFILNGVRYLWEHKAYDQYSEAVQFMTAWGMNKLPSQKAQTNAYMLGGGLEWCDFFVKVKNNNTYPELVYPIDRPFIEEIVEWCDKIRLEDWRPEPVECRWCSMCRVGCFGDIIDYSWIGSADSSEMVERWRKGKQLIDVGRMMQEEADAVFLGVKDAQGKYHNGLIGDKDLLILPGLEIKRVTAHRFDIDKQLILQEFGPDGLIKVGRERDVVQYRHKET